MWSPKVLFKAVLLILLQICTIAFASEQWQRIGLPGGEVGKIAVDRKHPTLVFAINSKALFRSTDSGHHWKTVAIPGVVDIGIHPITSEILVSSINNTNLVIVWASSDLGESFQHRYTGSFRVPTPVRFLGSPYDGNTWYGTDSFGLHVSLDSGRHWKRIDHFPRYPFSPDCGGQEQYGIGDFAISPFTPQVLFVSGYAECGGHHDLEFADVFLTSSDWGQSWRLAPNPVIKKFHLDPSFPKRLLGLSVTEHDSTNQGLFLLDSANGWEKLSAGRISEVLADPQKSSHLYAIRHFRSGTVTKIVESRDSGKTWKSSPIVPPFALTQLTALDNASKDLLGGTEGAGIFRHSSDLAPNEWKSTNHGLIGGNVTALAVSGSRIYAIRSHPFGGETGIQLFRSDNQGKSWINLTQYAPKDVFLNLLSSNPKNSEEVILFTNDFLDNRFVYLSTNGGRTWDKIISNVDSAGYDPTNPGVVYLVGLNSLYKSTDSGRNPQQISTLGLEFNSIWIDSTNSSTLYLYGGKLYKSTDSGASFRVIMSGIPNGYIQSLAPVQEPNEYLVNTRTGNYRTRNGGEQWEFLSSFPRDNPFFDLFRADEIGQHYYAVQPSGGSIQESIDTGRTWTDISTKIFSLVNPQVNFATTNGKSRVYLATDIGIFRNPKSSER